MNRLLYLLELRLGAGDDQSEREYFDYVSQKQSYFVLLFRYLLPSLRDSSLRPPNAAIGAKPAVGED
jgi:hypothetical protein